jgi:alkenylglycerophosphocholine/alkenylglycerophosphoethanolamine hydrolase
VGLPVAAVAAILVSAALAILAAERRWKVLHLVAKPLTTLLLLAVVGRPETRFAGWVDAGIALSVIGDVALLGSGQRAFLVGLAAFLLAHLAYLMAFAGVAAWSPHVPAAAVVVCTATALVLRAIWRGAAGLHGPTVAYGVAISAMVIVATATVGGAFAAGPLAAAGAVLFYVSDASLALNRFRRPIPHIAFWTLGVYWIGQLGIVLSARSGWR